MGRKTLKKHNFARLTPSHFGLSDDTNRVQDEILDGKVGNLDCKHHVKGNTSTQTGDEILDKKVGTLEPTHPVIEVAPSRTE